MCTRHHNSVRKHDKTIQSVRLIDTISRYDMVQSSAGHTPSARLPVDINPSTSAEQKHRSIGVGARVIERVHRSTSAEPE